MEVPEKPEEPLPSDCCNSGCSPCVLDVYRDLLRQWEEKCHLIREGVSPTSQQEVKSSFSLSPIKYANFKLVMVRKTSNDTFVYRFQSIVKQISGDCNESKTYRDVKQKLNIDPSQFLILLHNNCDLNDSKSISRAYTPISNSKTYNDGAFEVVIKIYPNGQMSQYIKTLKVGDVTYWRGPYGGFPYKRNLYKKLIMLCAGTGVAPMYSLANQIVHDDEEDTIIQVLFCCKDVDNIVLRDELNALQAFWNFSVDIYLSVSSSSSTPRYGESIKNCRLQLEHIKSEISFNQVNKEMVLICGSPSFSEEMQRYVQQCGVSSKFIHVF